MNCEAPGSNTGSKISYSDWIFLWFSSAPIGKTQIICQIRSQKLYSITCIKSQHNTLHCTYVFWLWHFTYVFRLVILPSSGRHFCYTNTAWSNVPDYYTILKLLLLLVRICGTGIGQSVQRLVKGWTVRGSKPGGEEIFHTCPDRPWGPPSLLYNRYRVFSGGKAARAWRWPPNHLHLAPRLRKE
jgi:hypothetical protein